MNPTEKIDETGKRYGIMTVLYSMEQDTGGGGSAAAKWMCKCDCGTRKIYTGRRLRGQPPKSCGCLRRRTVDAMLAGRSRP